MHRVDENASQKSDKPSHVRRLNFGRSILTLDTVKQFQGQKDGALTIDRDVARIPCTAKDDFVRKWIETHNDGVSDANETPCFSPVLGLPATESTNLQTSPVFGNRHKRAGGKSGLCVTMYDAEHRRFNDSENTVVREVSRFSIGSSKRARIDSSDRKKNIKRNLFDSPSTTVPSESTLTTASPVLLKNCISYKRRRRKFEGEKSRRKVLDCIENKCTEPGTKSPLFCVETGTEKRSPVLDSHSYCYKRKRKRQRVENLGTLHMAENSYVDSNMNTMLSCDFMNLEYSNDKGNIICSQKRRILIKKLENSFENGNLDSLATEDSKISEGSMGSRSSLSGVKLNIEDSPKDGLKENEKTEIEFSNEDDCSSKGVIDINNDTDPDFSDHIEDVDTQDLVLRAANDNRIVTNKPTFAVSKSVSSRSQASNKDSERTFFSEAEQLRCSSPTVRSSQKISQISSQTVDDPDSKSSQTGIVISSVSSPPRVPADSSIRVTLLDSAKKRKKPKRGSLLEKLQSAINRQVSFIRIWKHQMKQTTKDGISVPCVTVYVRSCTVRFSRQFLEGVAVEDSFGLLPHREGVNCVKFVKIMVIPDIVGKVEMNSGGLLQIFPPWEILDNEESVLNVTYIRVVPEDERDAWQCNKLNVDRITRSIVTNFDCPCIGANRMISSCKSRAGKPNVIEKLVTGS